MCRTAWGCWRVEEGPVKSCQRRDIRRRRIGLQKTWRIVEGPFQFFDQLFRGNACASSLGGPVKIAEVAKTYASEGFVNLVPLIAFISVSVGLFNLFPIPVLDGGHLLFYGAEAILGRPLNQRAQEIGFQFGFILLLMLMVFVTWNNIADISRGQAPVKKVGKRYAHVSERRSTLDLPGAGGQQGDLETNRLVGKATLASQSASF